MIGGRPMYERLENDIVDKGHQVDTGHQEAASLDTRGGRP